MKHEENQELDNRSHTALGVLVGLLVGAVAMLLFAPQSGQKTRKQIEDKSIELRDKTTNLVEDTVSQVRSKANQLMASGRKNLEELKHQGQELAVEQLDQASAAIKGGKTAVQNF